MQSVPAVRRLLGCNVYISEGRNLQLIRQLEAACHQHPKSVVLAHTFIDKPYNRTGFTLAANSIPELAATVHAVATHALAVIDLTAHAAQHPRLGVLDHVSIHPIGPDTTLPFAAQAAAAVGQQLSQPPLQLPVYYYGAAQRDHRRLADIRRRLGYFKPTSNTAPAGSSNSGSDSWQGSIQGLDLSGYPPDVGPHVAKAAAGVVTLGAVPWVTNFNIPLFTNDLAAAKAVAKAVSAKGGGLPGVEAMALPHGPGVIEVATNLLAYDACHTGSSSARVQQQAPSCIAAAESSSSSGRAGSNASGHAGAVAASTNAQQSQQSSSWIQQGAGPEEVAAAVSREAQLRGLRPPGDGYITNKTPADLMALAAKLLQHS